MSEKRVAKEATTCPPCREACPAGIDVPRYIRCIKKGKFDEALAVIRERIPFPSVCGYACYSPCEARCGNRQFGEPVAIRALKRAAAEKGGELWRKTLKIAPATGKRVAIVGSGPSGLTAAYYLATLGHEVTVLEALDRPGGMMRFGIPAYRLPKEALDRELEYLGEIGVEIKTRHRVNTVGDLFDEGYHAVYLACGAQRGARLDIPGEDAPGVVDGLSFLKRVNAGEALRTGRRVGVIGGGNTAFDAARCAIRLGAQEVIVFYRRSRAEMTAYEEEVGAALLEGVRIEFLCAPTEVVRRDGSLEVGFVRMELGKPDTSGRPAPVPIEGGGFRRQMDMLIVAVGQLLELPQDMGVAAGEGGFLDVDGDLSTGKKGVFAGGDAVTGPASIIEAIQQGRKAASSMDRFLGGEGIIDQELAPPEREVLVMEQLAEARPRVALACTPITERVSGFDPVERGLSTGMAVREAERCRSCDARQFEIQVYEEGCKECGYCIEVCGLGVFEPADTFNKAGYRPVKAGRSERCVGCMLCFYACPDFSIEVKQAG